MFGTVPAAIRPLPFQQAVDQFFRSAIRESQPQRTPYGVAFLRSTTPDTPFDHAQVLRFMLLAHPGVEGIFHERAEGFITVRVTQVTQDGQYPVRPIPFFVSAMAPVTGRDQSFHQWSCADLSPGAAGAMRINLLPKDVHRQFPGQGRLCAKQFHYFIHIV